MKDGTNGTNGTNGDGIGAHGDGDGDTPRDALGGDLWDALGAVEPASAPADRSAAPRDALGEDLWAVLGAADPVPEPVWGLRSVEGVRREAHRGLRRARLARAVGYALAAAVAGGLIGIAVWQGFGAGGVPIEDVPLVEQLDFAENLDLVGHPDFDVLLAWDGVAP